MGIEERLIYIQGITMPY